MDHLDSVDIFHPSGPHLILRDRPQREPMFPGQGVTVDGISQKDPVLPDLFQAESFNLGVLPRRAFDIHMGCVLCNPLLPQQIPERKPLPESHVGKGAGTDQQHLALQPGAVRQVVKGKGAGGAHQPGQFKPPGVHVSAVIIGAADAELAQLGDGQIAAVEVRRVFVEQVGKVGIGGEQPARLGEGGDSSGFQYQQEADKSGQPAEKTPARRFGARGHHPCFGKITYLLHPSLLPTYLLDGRINTSIISEWANKGRIEPIHKQGVALLIEFNLPKISLGFFPTPIVELSRLGKALGGAQLFMKRDDQTGLALGGNKTRKLEYLFGAALKTGCDCIITAGAAQSNHCRQAAAAAAKLNLECHLVLGGESPERLNGNLLLDNLFGSRIHWAGPHRKGEDIPRICEELRAAGKNPYLVPYGGSNEIGAMGFVEATRELVGQSTNRPFTHVVFASSSGGTQAGLMVGKKLFAQDFRLIGINIDKGESGEVPFDQQILALANQSAPLVGVDNEFSEDDLILNDDYVGDGYGVVGELEREAIKLTAQTEGILLDPVYTGRAMGGLIDLFRSGKIGRNDRVLFWHTGGTPALFAEPESLALT